MDDAFRAALAIGEPGAQTAQTWIAIAVLEPCKLVPDQALGCHRSIVLAWVPPSWKMAKPTGVVPLADTALPLAPL